MFTNSHFEMAFGLTIISSIAATTLIFLHASEEAENYHESICLFIVYILLSNLEFHSRHITHKINKLHEKALRIVCNDHFSSFEELLSKDKSVTVHQRNLQILAIVIYNILNRLSPDIMQDIFETRSNYNNTRNATAFSSSNIKIVRHGLQPSLT